MLSHAISQLHFQQSHVVPKLSMKMSSIFVPNITYLGVKSISHLKIILGSSFVYISISGRLCTKPNVHVVMGSIEFRLDLVGIIVHNHNTILTGHQENAEFVLAMIGF
ncbi:unnamed protein product [Lactuca virosa]|uniref:Uncharacterized protein n=1 Tax=Lactuca virosa TaxID=75947 RepID=A0AAU9NL69_9ASTR|nr:unnamed protein product [Lactuca virosa]